jgi:Glycosyl transferases group 1
LSGLASERNLKKLGSRVSRQARQQLCYAFETALARIGMTASGRQLIRIALVSDGIEITSEEQLHPFAACRPELRRKLGVVSLQKSLKDVLRAPQASLARFDLVILKLSFRKNRTEALTIAKTIKAATSSPLIYFDGDDDLCIQWPELLPNLDLYVKKHVFSDRSQYSRPWVGKSNLTNYVHEDFGVSFSDNPIAALTAAVPTEQISKITIGSNLATDRTVLDLYRQIEPQNIFRTRRDIDIIFRGSVPNDWMGRLREPLKLELDRLRRAHRVVVPDKRVAPSDYYREIKSSKICISPFGYGEICWRDFEAVLCGALLIKPDMSHVETNPDIFRPFETYVPVRWDFSDLQERCAYYLTHEHERMMITENAFNTLDQFYKNEGFVHAFERILNQLAAQSGKHSPSSGPDFRVP